MNMSRIIAALVIRELKVWAHEVVRGEVEFDFLSVLKWNSFVE